MKEIKKQLDLLDQVLTNIQQAELRVESAKKSLEVDAFLMTIGVDKLLEDVTISQKALKWWERRFTRVLGDLYTISNKQFKT